MTGLNPILSRTLALLLLVGVGMLAWFGLVTPIVQTFTGLVAEQEDLEGQRDRYLAAAAQRGNREAELEALKSKELAIEGLLDEPNAASAAAAMQTDVSEIITLSEGALRRVAVLPAEAGAAFEKIGLRLLFTADTNGFREILRTLEIERPAYRVGDLQVQGLASTRRRQGVQSNDILTVQLDVFGFRRIE